MAEDNARYDIRSIQFDEDGVTLQYMHLPYDVRARGALVATHTLTVSDAHEGWHNEIGDLRAAAHGLLVDALEDWPTADIVDLEDLVNAREDDDERGMGE